MISGITRSFTLAFTRRTGSNAICDLLSRNGMGAPSEWFQQPLGAGNSDTWLDTFSQVVNQHQAEGTFGSKMSHDHRARLDEALRTVILGYRVLDDVLPSHRWVWLVRRDKVLQAVSLVRALRSGRWGVIESDPGPPGEHEYDFFHVHSCVSEIQSGELAWELYFQEHGIEPYRIVYEDFFADVPSELPRLIKYLGGLPLSRTSIDLGQSFREQRDETSYAMRERYVADFGRVGETNFSDELFRRVQRKFPDVTRSFTMAFTMRTGSDAICDLLWRNGIGAPVQWFHTPLAAGNAGPHLDSFYSHASRHLDEPWLDAFSGFINQHQAEGTFGSKMSHDHRAKLDEALRAVVPCYQKLDDIFPAHRWLWLERRDKILQAISLCRAERSGQLVLTESDPGPLGDLEYDFFHIMSRIMTLQSAELSWKLYFQKYGIEPYKIVYEDFFADVDGQLRRHINHLGGLPASRTSIDFGQNFEVQPDDVSFALRDRFINDLCRIGETGFTGELGKPMQTWNRFFFDHGWSRP